MSTPVQAATLDPAIAQLPKAELHVHLEGSLAPATVQVLAARRGVHMSAEQVQARYAIRDFAGFIEAFKWVTLFLQEPEDYALAVHRLADELQRQNVVYAEVTVSAGVMLRRGQNVEANFQAIRETGQRAMEKGLRLVWIFDAVRQFGAHAAMEVATLAARLQPSGVVAFGLGGDELAYPAMDFRAAYEFARDRELHLVAHAGEIGSSASIRDTIEALGIQRIGHGIAAMRDPSLLSWLATRRIPLEICLSSNLATGALAAQLGRQAALADHPLKTFLEHGVMVTLSTDDPAMFATDLLREYAQAASLGLSQRALLQLLENSFQAAFVEPEQKRALLEQFRQKARQADLL